MDAIEITADMARFLEAAQRLLETAEPPLRAISVRVMTSAFSHEGVNPECDDEDVRGLAAVDVIYHLAGEAANETHEPSNTAALASGFVVERLRGVFSRAVYDANQQIFGASHFVVLLGLDADAGPDDAQLVAAAFPHDHSLHLLDRAETARIPHLPLLPAATSAHHRIRAAHAMDSLLFDIAEPAEPDSRRA